MSETTTANLAAAWALSLLAAYALGWRSHFWLMVCAARRYGTHDDTEDMP